MRDDQRLTEIGADPGGDPKKALYRCLCGADVIKIRLNVSLGGTRSCGCLQKERASNASRVHGLSRTSMHNIWWAMLQRCLSKNVKAYKDYGGRGITVCDRWMLFVNFLEDMGPRPSKDHTLDRVDNDGPYSPENCRWATRAEQANNRRSSRLIEFNGKTQTMAQWGKELGIHPDTIWSRLDQYKWSVQKALTEPVRGKK